MANPFDDSGTCSRCGTVGKVIFHVCKTCTDKAQQKYRDEVQAWANQYLASKS